MADKDRKSKKGKSEGVAADSSMPLVGQIRRTRTLGPNLSPMMSWNRRTSSSLGRGSPGFLSRRDGRSKGPS